MIRYVLILLSVFVIVSCSQPQPPTDPATPSPEAPPDPQPDDPDAPPDDGEEPDFEGGDEPGADLPEEDANLGACAGDPAEANSVYLSAMGDDSADGRSPATAWASLERLESALPSLAPGTQVLLERGAVFSGSLNLDNLQGSAGSPYTLGAYCEGDAPTLSALSTLTGWESVSANVWETTCETCGDAPKLLRLDGELQALGRWPNVDAENEGYLLYDDFAARSSLTDAELSATNWTGANAVVRTRPWVLDRIKVTSDSGNTINLGEGSTYDFWEGGGYFMQNHPATLDQNGEWVYDDATRKLQLYLDSDPANSSVQTGDAPVLLSLNDSRHITFENIRLEGAAQASVQGLNCADVRFANVSVQDAAQGVVLEDCQNVTFENSTLRNTLDNGLVLETCQNCKVTGSLLKDIAVFPGMGENGNYHYMGLQIGGSGSVVEYSEVNGVGHVPIVANSFAKVRYNKILNYHLTKIDGGGVYTYASQDVEIHNNIIARGLGTKTAIPWNTTLTNGIYIDQRSRNMRVYDNTIAYTTGSGIKVHSSQNNVIENNTVFAPNEAALELIEYVEPGELLNNTIRNNQFVFRGPNTYYLSAPTPNEASYFKTLGTLSNNSYCAPFNKPSIYQPYLNSAPAQQHSSLTTWQKLYDQDLGSSLCDFRYDAYRDVSPQGANLVSNASFDAETWNTEDAQLNVTEGKLGVSTSNLGGIVYTSVGEVKADKLYRLRFEAASLNGVSDLRTRLIELDDENFLNASFLQLVSVNETSASYELFLRPERDTAAHLAFYLANRDGTLYLDNIELQEVSATPTDFEDKVKLFTNPSKKVESFPLDGSYVDAAGQSYSGSVSVDPYESIVLFKD